MIWSGIRTVFPDEVGIDDPHHIFVLEKAAVARIEIVRMAAFHHFVRRHLHDRGAQPRLVRYDLDRVVLQHGARQRQRELLAYAHGAVAGLPPAANRVDFHHLRRRCGRGRVALREHRGRREEPERHESDEPIYQCASHEYPHMPCQLPCGSSARLARFS